MTYSPKFRFGSLPFCCISVSALGVLCTTCVLGLCHNSLNYRTGGATTTVLRLSRSGRRSKGWTRNTVSCVSPALKSVPTRSFNGLHAIYTTTMPGADHCEKEAPAVYVSSAKKQGEWHLSRDKFVTRHALATVASSP